ncbi:hypothetical protein KKC44_01945 [Patescibacteria group bacterium]|nr:hypothetical protein [Patescibacteria group bacterium]MBU2259344.1 hypothetical protein [Patescibacteria group bacterium]
MKRQTLLIGIVALVVFGIAFMNNVQVSQRVASEVVAQLLTGGVLVSKDGAGGIVAQSVGNYNMCQNAGGSGCQDSRWIRYCGDYNGDGFLEWSFPQDCYTQVEMHTCGAPCRTETAGVVGGKCVNLYIDQQTIGGAECRPICAYRQECDSNGDGGDDDSDDGGDDDGDDGGVPPNLCIGPKCGGGDDDGDVINECSCSNASSCPLGKACFLFNQLPNQYTRCLPPGDYYGPWEQCTDFVGDDDNPIGDDDDDDTADCSACQYYWCSSDRPYCHIYAYTIEGQEYQSPYCSDNADNSDPYFCGRAGGSSYCSYCDFLNCPEACYTTLPGDNTWACKSYDWDLPAGSTWTLCNPGDKVAYKQCVAQGNRISNSACTPCLKDLCLDNSAADAWNHCVQYQCRENNGDDDDDGDDDSLNLNSLRAARDEAKVAKAEAYEDYNSAKTDAWEGYQSAKADARSEYDDARTEARATYDSDKTTVQEAYYSDAKDEARSEYDQAKQEARAEYDSAKVEAQSAYAEAKEEYAAVREARSEAWDTYKQDRTEENYNAYLEAKADLESAKEERTEAYEEYTEAKVEAQSAYAQARDDARAAYSSRREADREVYEEAREEIKNTYEQSRTDARSLYDQTASEARSEYEDTKTQYFDAYLEAKAAYEAAKEAYDNAK